MSKWGWKSICLGVIAILAILWLTIAPIVSSYLSNLLGMRVSVGIVTLRPSHLKMDYFKIDNPYQYKKLYAMTADSIKTSFHWSDLTDDPRIIEQIEIDRVHLSIEFANALGTKNNWSDLLSRMPKRKKSAKEVIIRKIILTNITVDILGMNIFAQSKKRTIDRLEFTDVSSIEGFPIRELIAQIFGNTNLLDYIKNIVPGGPGGIIKKLLPFEKAEKEKGQENPGPSLDDELNLY